MTRSKKQAIILPDGGCMRKRAYLLSAVVFMLCLGVVSAIAPKPVAIALAPQTDTEKFRRMEELANIIRSYLPDGAVHYLLGGRDLTSRLELFTQIFMSLQERFHVDIKQKSQCKRLAIVSYKIVKKGQGGWNLAQNVMDYLEQEMGFSLGSGRFPMRSKLMSIVYGLAQRGQAAFFRYKEFLRYEQAGQPSNEIQPSIATQFGIDDYKKIPLDMRQKILTAAYYATGSKNRVSTFQNTIQHIQTIFGITAEELSKKPAEGGLELAEKIRLITAAYAVSLGKEGFTTFQNTIQHIQDTLGISDTELKQKVEQGGLPRTQKLKIIAVAYQVVAQKSMGRDAKLDLTNILQEAGLVALAA